MGNENISIKRRSVCVHMSMCPMANVGKFTMMRFLLSSTF